MDNIVERLRGTAPPISYASKTLYEAAADEIERLRQKINRADRYLALGSPNAARDVLNECGTVET